MNDLIKAKEILKNGSFTCVFVSGEKTLTFCERGVKPLLSLLSQDENFESFCAADKVVGKAAAFLYIMLGVKTLHACTISEPALSLLRGNGISVSYDTLVPMIRNRTNTGFCPMEQATMNCTSPEDALAAIKETLERLNTRS